MSCGKYPPIGQTPICCKFCTDGWQLVLASSHTTISGSVTDVETRPAIWKLVVFKSPAVQPFRFAVLNTVSKPSSPRLTAGSRDPADPVKAMRLRIPSAPNSPTLMLPLHPPVPMLFNSNAANPKLISAELFVALTFSVAVVGGKAIPTAGSGIENDWIALQVVPFTLCTRPLFDSESAIYRVSSSEVCMKNGVSFFWKLWQECCPFASERTTELLPWLETKIAPSLLRTIPTGVDNPVVMKFTAVAKPGKFDRSILLFVVSTTRMSPVFF